MQVQHIDWWTTSKRIQFTVSKCWVPSWDQTRMKPFNIFLLVWTYLWAFQLRVKVCLIKVWHVEAIETYWNDTHRKESRGRMLSLNTHGTNNITTHNLVGGNLDTVHQLGCGADVKSSPSSVRYNAMFLHCRCQTGHTSCNFLSNTWAKASWPKWMCL